MRSRQLRRDCRSRVGESDCQDRTTIDELFPNYIKAKIQTFQRPDSEQDEVGFFASEKKTQVYDYLATVLHLLGIDHEQLTFYHNGIQRRLTDVHGEVIHDILA